MNEDAFGPGWFERAAERVREQTKDWPDWKIRADLQPPPPTYPVRLPL